MKVIIFDFNRTLYDPDMGSLIAGCLEVLEALSHKYRLVLITTETGSRGKLIYDLGLRQFFQKVVMASSKSKEVFLNCCKELGVSPDEVMVVGDRVRGEIAIGNELGMFTVQFQNGPFAKELPEDESERPKIIIKKLEELLNYG